MKNHSEHVKHSERLKQRLLDQKTKNKKIAHLMKNTILE